MFLYLAAVSTDDAVVSTLQPTAGQDSAPKKGGKQLSIASYGDFDHAYTDIKLESEWKASRDIRTTLGISSTAVRSIVWWGEGMKVRLTHRPRLSAEATPFTTECKRPLDFGHF